MSMIAFEFLLLPLIRKKTLKIAFLLSTVCITALAVCHQLFGCNILALQLCSLLILLCFIIAVGSIRDLLIVVALYLGLGIIEALGIFLVYSTLGSPMESMPGNHITNLIFELASTLIIYAITFASIKLKGRKDFKTKNITTLLVLTIIGLFAFVQYLFPIQFYSVASGLWYEKRILAGGIVSSVILFTVMLLGLYYIHQRERYRIYSQVYAQLVEKQKDYYTKLLSNDKEIRKIRHDLDAHVFLLDEFLKAGKYQAAESYLATIKGQVNKNSLQFNTGNDVLNMLINDSFSDNADVELLVNGQIPNTLRITDIEMCSLFSNMFSNAMDAAILAVPPRTIQLDLKMLSGNIQLLLDNPCAEPLKFHNGVPVTKKDDTINHGLGTQNMMEVINKYNGSIEYSWSDGHLSTSVVLLNVCIRPAQ